MNYKLPRDTKALMSESYDDKNLWKNILQKVSLSTIHLYQDSAIGRVQL
jgi:hypothetical protein